MSHPGATVAAMAYRLANKTVFLAQYRIIWCPKYRRRVLVDGVDARLKAIVEGVAVEAEAEVIEVPVVPDRVHLVVEIPLLVLWSRFVQLLKGRSSCVLREEFPVLGRFASLWTRSWFVLTVRGAPLEVVREYVEGQKMAG